LKKGILRELLDNLWDFFRSFFSGEFFRTIKREFHELKEFYLDEEPKVRLRRMGRIRRFFLMPLWLLKSLLLKLTPFRRILLLIGIIFILQSSNSEYRDVRIGLLIMLFVLLLELKDKLLAKDELNAGRKVQLSLTPERNPIIPGWDVFLYTQPANEVGGDMVDFIKLDEHHFGVALADISGKGLGAALLMARLQAILRALAPTSQSLSDLGAKINHFFYGDSLPNSFASLVYLEMEGDSSTIRFLNAGHMPPLLISDTDIQELAKGEPALGLRSDTSYSERKIELGTNDCLLVYSDGVTEAQNEEGEFFGEERLKALLRDIDGLSPDEIGERLLAKVHAFVSNARIHDDLSLFIIKRKNH